MIPEFLVNAWSAKAPWQNLLMIEQDLVISRALIDLYNRPLIKESLAFRGGTALNKLYITPAARYSEDIDLVQIKAAPIGPVINEIREALDPWLGVPQRNLTKRSAKLVYRYKSVEEGVTSRLKIEINTTEHFHVHPLEHMSHEVNSEWMSGKAEILTYNLDELMGTKLRALYQRRKGRDLFDLWYVIEKNLVDLEKVVSVFNQYNEYNKEIISRAMFEESLLGKIKHPNFHSDMNVLFSSDSGWDAEKAFARIWEEVVPRLKGDPWKIKKEGEK